MKDEKKKNGVLAPTRSYWSVNFCFLFLNLDAKINYFVYCFCFVKMCCVCFSRNVDTSN